ncbi:unnamed protein product [Cyclocybe aegerita]|uniref:Reverse transcriptase Ty1/copia-type domain-containing protein n=1 Tax=Cyclocybe aegerita TaxID=1973307 RepID=A0A8S0W7X6_CYCAE|nr:unnamed protein product [Cyclocybe aegerita]
MIFVGFNDGSKSIRYYDPSKRNIKSSRNVSFNENEEPHELTITELPGLRSEGEQGKISTSSQTIPQKETAQQAPIEEAEPLAETPETPQEPDSRQLRERKTPIDYKKLANPDSKKPAARLQGQELRYTPTPSPPPDPTRHTKASQARARERAHFARSGNYTICPEVSDDKFVREIIEGYMFINSPTEPDIPRTVDEALQSPEAFYWEAAMREELATIKKMNTWEETDLPEGRTAIGSRWVFDKKHDEHGNVIKYKARIVAQGFSQKPGTDYSNDGTFAPVMRFETLRTGLGLAAINGWDLRQFDVKGAYLNGYLEEEIYMRQPPGFDDGTGRVCLLKRSLYGLKQAGNVWNKEFDRAMQDLGFNRLKSDSCCYLRRTGDDFEILLVWVDDILSIASTSARNDVVEKDLGSKFEIKALGRPRMLLGMGMAQNDEEHTISLFQTAYIDSLLKKYGLDDCNSVTTPLDPNVRLDDDSDEETKPGVNQDQDERLSVGYATLIGSLMYLAIGTRPDIAYTVQKLAQFTQNPKPKHWTAVKRIFRYLKGTRTHALTYSGSDDFTTPELNIYCDADCGSNANRKSVSGYVVTLAGGAVSWSSKKQTTVALSTAEAEYVAATHAAKQVLWHRSLFTELGIDLPTTSTIFSDNQATVSIAHHPEFHARTKHIDIALHFLRDLVQNGTLNLVYINTNNNLADLFTKGLPRSVHQDLTTEIGVLSE